MTGTIMELMEEKRGCKRWSRQQYRIPSRTIQGECITKKKRWIEEMCTEIEDFDKGDKQLMYKKVQ